MTLEGGVGGCKHLASRCQCISAASRLLVKNTEMERKKRQELSSDSIKRPDRILRLTNCCLNNLTSLQNTFLQTRRFVADVQPVKTHPNLIQTSPQAVYALRCKNMELNSPFFFYEEKTGFDNRRSSQPIAFPKKHLGGRKVIISWWNPKMTLNWTTAKLKCVVAETLTLSQGHINLEMKVDHFSDKAAAFL